jgi:iron complex transport system ATP-binding protein
MPWGGRMRLKVQGIEFGYKSANVLTDVGFEAEAGEVVGVLGPNGSGKTTLLKCMNRALNPQGGSVLVEDKEITELSRKEVAREIGVVPQNSSVNFPFTALEIVLMGRGPSLGRFEREGASDLALVKQAMSDTDVLHLAGRPMTELSGGEKQRVIIARALAQRPKILLLDEPTLHLDVNHQLDILDMVRGLAKKDNMTVIMVSHDLNLAARYCDKIILLEEGRILAAGAVPEVLDEANMERVFKIRGSVVFDPRINAYSVTIIGSTKGRAGSKGSEIDSETPK